MEASSQSRHKQVECYICDKKMRSDHLSRHVKTHEKDHTEVIPDDILLARLLNSKETYTKNIAQGQRISEMVASEHIPIDSLLKKDRHCLDLYMNNRPRIDISSATLKKWQQQAFEMLTEPSDREVIWIIGKQGNEGKTWFQAYVESYFGYARVARLELTGRSKDICHALGKRPLISTDLFLFNVSRSSLDLSDCYPILEFVKDGLTVSTKYDSKRLQFTTPNVLMIFSNSQPDKAKLSSDRWVIFTITPDEKLELMYDNVNWMKKNNGGTIDSPEKK